MKKATFLLFITIVMFNSLNAQMLWSETFDNYTLGNVGTDVTGNIPGQGNWYTRGLFLGNDVVNENYRIEFETGRGKYMILESATIEERGVFKGSFRHMINNIGSIWALKDSANNILKIEFEYNYYYYNIDSDNYSMIVLSSDTLDYRHSHGLNLDSDWKGALQEVYNGEVNNYLPDLLVAPNLWHKTIIYVDIDNNESYVEYPSKNYAVKTDHKNKQLGKYPFDPLDLNRFDIVFNSQDNFYGTSFLKIDNIIISAVNALPTLNIIDLDSSKFNLYPNPTTNVVSITSSDNMFVNQVQVYDLSGKLINIQNFTNETEIQLNVETLKSGSYLLHLQTDQGIAVKKLIKK